MPTPASPARPSIVPASGFELRRHLASEMREDWSRPRPTARKAAAPTTGKSLTPSGGDGIASVPSPSLRGKAAQPLHGAQPKPGRGTDDDAEIDQRQDGSRQFRAIAEQAREPAEDRIERDRQHHAPGRGSERRAGSRRTTSRRAAQAARAGRQAGFRPRPQEAVGSVASGPPGF